MAGRYPVPRCRLRFLASLLLPPWAAASRPAASRSCPEGPGAATPRATRLPGLSLPPCRAWGLDAVPAGTEAGRVLSPAGSWRRGTHRGKADGGAGGPEAARAGGGEPGTRTQKTRGGSGKITNWSWLSLSAGGEGSRSVPSARPVRGRAGARGWRGGWRPRGRLALRTTPCLRSRLSVRLSVRPPTRPSFLSPPLLPSPPSRGLAPLRRSPRPPVVCCFPGSQDGVRVEARRAGAPADPAAAEGISVPGHHHAESRATSILGRGLRRVGRTGQGRAEQSGTTAAARAGAGWAGRGERPAGRTEGTGPGGGRACPGTAALRWAEPPPERAALARRLNRRSGLWGRRAAVPRRGPGHLLRARSQRPLLLFKALALARPLRRLPLYWVTPRWAAASTRPSRGGRAALAAADPAKSAGGRCPRAGRAASRLGLPSGSGARRGLPSPSPAGARGENRRWGREGPAGTSAGVLSAACRLWHYALCCGWGRSCLPESLSWRF